MKTSNEMIILTSFLLLCIVNSIEGKSCAPSKCPKGVNTSAITIEASVEYPFRLEGNHDKSCGVPGFDLYCDKTLGTLIQLPNNVVLRVDYISYYNEYITLSDPYNCLPRKLMSLNLTNTPFTSAYTRRFWLYNCSADDYWPGYDQIHCLSGSNYAVLSTGYPSSYLNSSCSSVKILSAPTSDYDINSISSIHLTWTRFAIPPPPWIYNSSTNLSGIGLIIGGSVVAILILFCCCRYCLRRNARATSTATTVTNADATARSQRTQPSTAPVVVVVGGLDQVTIDSYPVVVLCESGHGGLLKSEDNICSICLSDYEPRETIKILPECVHRFHKECIDQWLRSKGVCPICRTSPLTSLLRQIV